MVECSLAEPDCQGFFADCLRSLMWYDEVFSELGVDEKLNKGFWYCPRRSA
jgi:hypothetical protein